jgi:hypothetical protein
MNRRHLAAHPDNGDLEARIASFQLAARMQLVAAEALDLSRESDETQRLYGLDDPLTRVYGSNCPPAHRARRALRSGLHREPILGPSRPHRQRSAGGLPADRQTSCRARERPQAARSPGHDHRALGGPVIQGRGTNRAAIGPDHDVFGFSTWLAGGGFKAGHIHGATDEFGYKAVELPVRPSDYHATLLHLFGLNHQRLVFRHGPREESLIENQPCRIVREILA